MKSNYVYVTPRRLKFYNEYDFTKPIETPTDGGYVVISYPYHSQGSMVLGSIYLN